MKGDFSRNTFDAKKHFRRVLMQQGRVQLDADWNEMDSILLHYIQTLAVDLIGPYGGPLGDNLGFAISAKPKAGMDFGIGKGRYYVNGILCENEEPQTFANQPDYPLTDDQKAEIQKNLQDGSDYMIYLDVWERHLTYLDDDSIREVALGGPDTTTRSKVVWQVKVTGKDAFTKMMAALNNKKAKTTMQAKLKTENIIPDPCITPPDSKYRGAENQLYRVEIHNVDLNANDTLKSWTFKWSRENGSVAAAWLGTTEDGGLIVNSTHGFEAGSYVEITTANNEMHNTPGPLTKIAKIEGGALYLEKGPAEPWDAKTPVKFRQWDQRSSTNDLDSEGAVIGVTGKWLNLEKGIQVMFQPGDKDTPAYWFRSGDYWQIPARVVGGKIEWPADDEPGEENEPEEMHPTGIWHAYAPLWAVTWKSGAFTIKAADDQRLHFKPSM